MKNSSSRRIYMTTPFSERVLSVSNERQQQQKMISKIRELVVEFNKGTKELNELINASRILVTVTDINTKKVTSFIESVINKALMEMYPSGEYYIQVQQKIKRNNNSIEVFLYDNDNQKGEALDLNEQAGDGISRIIAFLFSLSLIELCGYRKFVSLDEVLTGFHSDSLQIVKNIIEIFKDGGFQFIACEYDINDMGVLYEGRKVGNQVKMEELGFASEVNYVRTMI